MPDTQVLETQVAPVLPIGAVKDKPGVILVTTENFGAYADQELGITRAEDGDDADNDPEAEAAKEAETLEAQRKAALAKETEKENAPREGDVNGAEVFFEGRWVNKHNFKYRVHLKSEETRKELQKAIDKAAEDAKVSREAAEAAKTEAAALKAKYEPPKSEKLGPKPLPQQFADVAEYGAALESWTADKTRADDAEKQAQVSAKAEADRTVKAWNDRLAAFKAETPDFDEKLKETKVTASEQLQQAIIESEAGPQIFYHLLDNPDEAEAIGKMTVAQMLRAVGRLEVTLGGGIGGTDGAKQTKAAPVAAVTKKPVIEVSKASAPIIPLKGAHALPTVSSAAIAAIADPTARHAAFVAARKAKKF
jgi:hypothetical protein